MLRTRITLERCLILLQVSSFLQIEASDNCSGNVYLDKELGVCLPCSSCDAFSIQLQECTNTSNTVCLNCVGHNKEKDPACERCPPCRRGQYLSSPCTPESPSECQRCKKGTYSAKPSYSTRCLTCLDCKGLNRRVVRHCKTHKDAVCGKCKKGYYEVSGSRKCLPCRPCTSGSQKVQACQRWGGDKSCGFVVRRLKQRKLGTVLKYEFQTTTGSNVLKTSADYIIGTPKPERRGQSLHFYIIAIIIVLPIVLALSLVLVTVFLVCSHKRRKKAARTIKAEEKKSLINDKKNTEVTLSPFGHSVSLSSSESHIVKPLLSLSYSDPGQRSLHHNASVLEGLLSPFGKMVVEQHREPQWSLVLNTNSSETSGLKYSPEPLQPPPPPPLYRAFFEPPEIPPRRNHDFKTL